MSEVVDVLRELGLELKKVSCTNGGEYKGPCPECGGTDRLTVSPEHPKHKYPVFICRQCGIKGYVNKLISTLGGGDVYFKPRKVNSYNRVLNQKEHPSPEWQSKIKNVLGYYTKHKNTFNAYYRRGIYEPTVIDLKFSALFKQQQVNINRHKTFINPGLLIPNYRSETLWGVQVRTDQDLKYQYIKGSVAVPYHFTKLDQLDAPVIVVESALDAAILYQEAGDLIHAVALGSATNKPDMYIRVLFSKATRIILCLDHDQAGFEALQWWNKEFPHVRVVFTPTGKDMGDYHISGNCVRSWVEQLINGEAPPRPVPQVQAYILEKKDIVDKLNEIAAEETIGISVAKQFLALAVDDQAFVMKIKDVPKEALACLNLVTYDGVSLIKELNRRGIDIPDPECISLQFHTISNMNWSLDKLAHFRLGYGSDEFESADQKAAVKAHVCLKINEIQKAKIEDRNLGTYYRLLLGAQRALAQMSINGIGFDPKIHDEVCADWEMKLNSGDSDNLCCQLVYVACIYHVFTSCF